MKAEREESNLGFNSHRPCVFDDPKNVIGIPRQESTNNRILLNEIEETDDKFIITVYIVHNRKSGMHKTAKRFTFEMYDEMTPYLADEHDVDIPTWMNEIYTQCDFYKNPLNPSVHQYITTSVNARYIGENIWYIDDTMLWIKVENIWIQVALEWLIRFELSNSGGLTDIINEWRTYKNLSLSWSTVL